MGNSPLVSYTKISPNKTSPRNHAIDTITIHCVEGQCSVETLGNIFAPLSKAASSNYGIGPDGRIGMYVEEKDRSWCSSNSANDNRAITIEVASDTYHPYAVKDAVYNALIDLLVDICKRNDIKKLLWKGDKSLIGCIDKQNMTVHRWFANKSCPGDYLYNRHGQIAAEVNKRLGVSGESEVATAEKPSNSEGSNASDVTNYPVILIGSSGTYVEKAQKYLNEWGYSLDVDGIFGELTGAATRDFQKKHGLDPDGVIGQKTWPVLAKIEDKTDTNKDADENKVTDADVEGYTKIVSESVATSEQMIAYIKARNKNVAQSVLDMIPFYISEGKIEGIAGDIAFAQSCLETGNFSFAGSSIALSQNNFCGMGATSNNVKGNSFETPQIGIRAQIQHLKAYASIENLVNECVDPRFKYATRGCAKYVEWLGAKENPSGKGWASGAGYGSKILAILNDVRKTEVNENTNTAHKFKVGDLVSIDSDAKYYNGKEIPVWVKKQNWYISSISGDRIVIDRNESGDNSIKSPINSKYLTLVKEKTDCPFLVKVDISYLNIRTGPGTNYDTTGNHTGKGVFTIVDVSNGNGSSSGWGKLKSGAGWISLDYTTKV